MKKDRKGQVSNFAKIAFGFLLAVVGFVITVVLLENMLAQNTIGCNTAGYVYNTTTGQCNQVANASARQGASYSGNITADGLGFAVNFSDQWGLAGTILGYTLVLAILALIGLGGYVGWQKFRGLR